MSFLICHLIGHKWKYKDYNYAVHGVGLKYNYTASRFCSRCEKKEYKLDKWVGEKFISHAERNFYE